MLVRKRLEEGVAGTGGQRGERGSFLMGSRPSSLLPGHIRVRDLFRQVGGRDGVPIPQAQAHPSGWRSESFSFSITTVDRVPLPSLYFPYHPTRPTFPVGGSFVCLDRRKETVESFSSRPHLTWCIGQDGGLRVTNLPDALWQFGEEA